MLGIYSEIIIICLMGLFGGFIFSLQKGQMVLPHRENAKSLNLGFVSNCLFGIAGAIVIFLIVPGDFEFNNPQSSDFIKSLATALIGGWGGLTIVEKAFSSSLTEIEKKLKEKEEQEKVDVVNKEDITQYLNSSTSSNLTEREILEKVKQSSPLTRSAIFSEAQKVRSETWNTNKKKMERTVPVFEALADTAEGEEKTHQVYGQLGFALKDQTNPNYMEAKENLDKAIDLRDKNKVIGFTWYEFNRAICQIHLDNNFRTKAPSDNSTREIISSDLRTAFSDALLLQRLEKNASVSGGDQDIFTLREWLELNNVSGASVGIGWLDPAK